MSHTATRRTWILLIPTRCNTSIFSRTSANTRSIPPRLGACTFCLHPCIAAVGFVLFGYKHDVYELKCEKSIRPDRLSPINSAFAGSWAIFHHLQLHMVSIHCLAFQRPNASNIRENFQGATAHNRHLFHRRHRICTEHFFLLPRVHYKSHNNYDGLILRMKSSAVQTAHKHMLIGCQNVTPNIFTLPTAKYPSLEATSFATPTHHISTQM